MKKALTYLILILLQFGSVDLLLAQEDSSRIELVSSDSITKYLSPSEYAFMMHEETKVLFKLELPESAYLIGNNVNAGSSISLGMEFKIAPSWSINSSLRIGTFVRPNQFEVLRFYTFTPSVDLRWYYTMHNQNKKAGFASSMSGNYVALFSDYRITVPDLNSELNSIYYSDVLNLGLKWGMQRRFLNYGYIDLSLAAGASIKYNYVNSNNQERQRVSVSESIYLRTNMSFGLGFAKKKYTLDKDYLCPILKCHEADGLIFKINFNDIININLSNEEALIRLIPNITLETKIFESPFSFLGQISTNINFYFGELRSAVYDPVSTTFLIEWRYYYNLKKRILSGKTGNGLSANYVGLGSSYFTDYKGNYGLNGYSIILNTGIQRLISNHFYVDYSINLNYKFQRSIEQDNYNYYLDEGFYIGLKLAVGYRF